MLTLRKINLREIKNSLKRDEMRMIFGGCGGGSCKANCSTCSANSECCSTVCATDQPGCGGGRRCLR